MNLLIMSTIYDTPVFRLSLRSLIDTTPSNYKIVVVEDGLYKERKCEEFCSEVGVQYEKYPEHNSMGQMFKWTTSQFSEINFDYINLLHNDLFFPDDWSSYLESAWDRLSDANQTTKCPVVNLSHNEYSFKNWQPPTSQPTYESLYSDLYPFRFYHAALDSFFGLSQDRWNMNRVGRLSPFISITKGFFDEIQFEDTGHGYDCEILWNLSQRRLWSIWVDNTRLLHFRPTESGNDTVLNHKEGQGADHYNWMEKNVKKCEEIFGIDLEKWLDVEFGLIKQLHKEEIEDVFNNRPSELASLDYIFEEVKDALA